MTEYASIINENDSHSRKMQLENSRILLNKQTNTHKQVQIFWQMSWKKSTGCPQIAIVKRKAYEIQAFREEPR